MRLRFNRVTSMQQDYLVETKRELCSIVSFKVFKPNENFLVQTRWPTSWTYLLFRRNTFTENRGISVITYVCTAAKQFTYLNLKHGIFQKTNFHAADYVTLMDSLSNLNLLNCRLIDSSFINNSGELRTGSSHEYALNITTSIHAHPPLPLPRKLASNQVKLRH